MFKVRKILPVALALVAAGGVVACGDDDDDDNGGSATAPATAPASTPDAPTGTTLSKEEFISQGDVICADGDTKVDALTEPTDEATLTAFLAEGATISAETGTKFLALIPPDDEGKAVQEAVRESLEEGTALATQAGTTLASEGYDAAVAELQETETPANDNAEKLAEEYGFQECGPDDE